MTGTEPKALLAVLSGKPVSPTPIWLMRQAGRYLSEYRDLRAKAGDFMTLCFTPDFATEVTLQPIRRFGFDAAILFSDILVIPHALGQRLWFAEGEGPKLEKFGPADFAKMKAATANILLAPVFETVSRVKATLPSNVTLIGFAGAPWTVANYMVAGGSSDDSEDLRRFAATHPANLDGLMETLVEATALYLIEQVRAGAEVLQIFESWGGAIPAGMVDKYSVEPIRKIISRVRNSYPSIPFIVFPRGSGMNLSAYTERTGANGVSIDFQTSLAKARSIMSPALATQGNLDPMVLAVGGEAQSSAISQILEQTAGTPHIFNLGHGIRQETPIRHVENMIAQVRAPR